MYLCVCFPLLVEFFFIFCYNRLVTNSREGVIIITNNIEKEKTHEQNNIYFHLCLVLSFTFISQFFISNFQWFKLDCLQITTFVFCFVLFVLISLSFFLFFTVSCIHFNVFYVLLLKLRFIVNKISSSVINNLVCIK